MIDCGKVRHRTLEAAERHRARMLSNAEAKALNVEAEATATTGYHERKMLRREAKALRREARVTTFRVYHCSRCDAWHVTRQSPEARLRKPH